VELEHGVALRNTLARRKQNPAYHAIDLRNDLNPTPRDDKATELLLEVLGCEPATEARANEDHERKEPQDFCAAFRGPLVPGHDYSRFIADPGMSALGVLTVAAV